MNILKHNQLIIFIVLYSSTHSKLHIKKMKQRNTGVAKFTQPFTQQKEWEVYKSMNSDANGIKQRRDWE
jgi:hypothetical protein